MWSDRCFRTFCLALLFCVAFANLNPFHRWSSRTGMSFVLSRAESLSREPVYDLVILGDSRVGQNVKPRLVSKAFRDPVRVTNFALGNCTYTHAYLQEAESFLRNDSPYRAIVLSVAVDYFLDGVDYRNNLDRYFREKNARFEIWFEKTFYPVLDWFRPVTIFDVHRTLVGTHRVVIDVQPGGWSGLVVVEPKPELAKVLELRAEVYRKHSVSQERLEAFYDIVRKWRQSGVKVYGYYPHFNKEWEALAKTQTTFDAKVFEAEFSRAGGRMIPLPNKGYITYDSAHYEIESVDRFSEDLGKQLAILLEWNDKMEGSPQD